MANLTKSLTMPNGQEYEFVGKHWYGVCSTNGNTQTKSVSITGFSSADLVNGTQVTVYFSNGQYYNGVPNLNVSNTGAKSIYASGSAELYEWSIGAIITFVYDSSHWYIVDGQHATVTCFGKTKLSNTISDNDLVALTPKAVYDAGYVNASGAAAAAPVQSVNGQTGAVSLTIPTVPTNVSAFINDAGYLTSNDIGSVFTLKGSVYQYSDLPTTGNTEGDVYYVEEDETISGTLYPGQVGYIWITDSNNVARWEELGQTIDTSEFQPLITTNGVLQGNGSGNISAITVDTTPTANSTNLVTSGGVRAAIPTNVSSLNNDSGYLTLATLPIWDGTVQ